MGMQVVVGVESLDPKSIARALRMQANLLEGMSPKEAASNKNTAADVDEDDVDADEDFAPKKKTAVATKKAAASFDDDEDDDTTVTTSDDDDEDFAPKKKAASKKAASFEDDEDDEVAPPAKKTKAKKITLDDVQDALKARASETGGKEGRKEVLAILKKHFKTETVSELKPEQYESVIAKLKAN